MSWRVAAGRGGTAGSRVRGRQSRDIHAILARYCQTPGTPCAYRIARSRRSAVPYTALYYPLHRLDQVQAS